MFVTALFITTKSWEQSNCPSNDKWIKWIKKKNRGVATLRNKEEQTIDICNNKNDSKKLYAK